MEKELRTIILAAGKGTRMKSEKPKVLHEIFSKPLIGWVLDTVESLPYKVKSTVVIGHGAHDVEEYLNKNYKYATTALQKEQLGTGHAVSQAVSNLHNYSGTVIITCGDTPLITKNSLLKLINCHQKNNADLTVMTAFFDNPFGYGRIIRNSNDEVIKIVEQKDATEEQKEIKEVNAGIYCLNWAKIKNAFFDLKNNNSQGEYYLTDIINWARKANLKVLGTSVNDYREIYGINSRKNLEEATRLMNEMYLDKLMDEGVTIVDTKSTFISPDTTIEPDTTIFPCCYIEGKNKIAKNCKIGPMTHIRGNCEISEGCKIGNFVELKNAKIAKKTNVCHLTYMGDAVVGNNVNIGAGTIFANYNSITKEKKISELKDGVSIGSNSVIVAPVKIGKDAFVAASSCITKDIEQNSLAISRSPQKEFKNWVTNKKKEK